MHGKVPQSGTSIVYNARHMSAPTYIINGSFNHHITPLDRGFSYGDGVFRTLKMRGGLPLNWPLHYQKLVADCAAIGIVCPSAELLMSDFEQLVTLQDTDKQAENVAKIIITRGEGERGYQPPAVTSPTRVVIKSSMPQYLAAYDDTGVTLTLCQTRLSPQGKLAGVKHLNRLENVLARMEWRDETIFDGLLLDQQNNVIECTMSNVFIRINNTLFTPDLSQCGVAGVTRQRVLSVAHVLNLKIEITSFSLYDFTKADEVMICNSLFGCYQVTRFLNQTWPIQHMAKSFKQLLAQHSVIA